MRLWKLMLLIMIITLAACQPGGDNSATTAPEGINTDPNNPVQWNRDPNSIVFQADVVGGEDASSFYYRSSVPGCTIYGDNRIVWNIDQPAGSTQVLWDRLSDAVIRNFISQLTVQYRFFTYDARASLEPPSSVAPVVETISLTINGATHSADAFGGWPRTYYRDVLNLCQSLSQAPVIYQPDGAWISALAAPYNTNVPTILWDGKAAGFELRALAAVGEPRWATGQVVVVLWNYLRESTPDMQFTEGESNYYVAVQVPNITRDAPPAPKPDEITPLPPPGP